MSLFLAGHFPALERSRPMPRPTPGYRPPRPLELPELRPDVAPLADLTGMTFGELTVRGLSGSCRAGRLWSCACTCGASRDVTTHDLVRGAVRSCGHLRAARLSVRLPPWPPSRSLWLGEWRGLPRRLRGADLWLAVVARPVLVTGPGLVLPRRRRA